MNERIRELAFEANTDLDGNVPLGFAEKFAELIIRECVSVADYNSDGHIKDQFGRKMFHYHVDIGKEITDYFGVEE